MSMRPLPKYLIRVFGSPALNTLWFFRIGHWLSSRMALDIAMVPWVGQPAVFFIFVASGFGRVVQAEVVPPQEQSRD